MRAYISGDLSRKHFKRRVYRNGKRRKARYFAGCYMEVADNGKEYVREMDGKGNFASYHKRCCNRRIRHMENIGNHGYYRKAEEYSYIVD